MKKTIGRRALALLTGSALLIAGAVPLTAFAGAGAEGEELETVAPEDKNLPDPDTLEPVDVNFAKALQLSLYFYDENKCGTRTGNVEWRGNCHMEDAAVPLIPMTEKKRGTNLSQEFIDEHRDILDPDGDGTIDVEGGMHDAGDCVKFCLPGSYAASTVGWGYYEFRDAYEDAGQAEHCEQILHAFNDYYLKCLYYDENGEDVLAFCYQVGEGNIDHNYWITPDLQGTWLLDFERPAYFATKETPASDMCAGVAASLAVNYLNFKDTEPEYAAESLKAAKALYKFACETHSEQKQKPNTGDDKPVEEHEGYDPENPDAINKGNENTTMVVTSLGYDGGFYTSSYDYDELAWAAVWLYWCTEDDQYIEDIIGVDESVTLDNGGHPYKGWIRRIITDTGRCWQNIWVHCWDTVWGGVFAKLAPATNTARDWYIFRWNLEFWSGMNESEYAKNKASGGIEPAVTSHKYFGMDDELWNKPCTYDQIPDLEDAQGAFLMKTPAGFAMLNEYGSARYDTAALLCAMVYQKETGDDTFLRWSADQMSYIMGNNPMGRSYIVGYDLENGASHPHHRASHGSTTYSMDDPATQTHVLWGALVGGPDATDWHRDITKDYIYNEVAVDYNAGFVGACAGLYKYVGKDAGDKPEENFPPSELELKGKIEEFTLKAAVGQEDNMATQVLVEIDSHTFLPPRYLDGIDVRYYFNIAEMLKNGQTIDDLNVRIDYDSLKSNTNGEYQCTVDVVQYNDKGDCYLNIHWPESKLYGKAQFQFALMADKIAIIEGGKDDGTDLHTFIWDPTNDYSREQIRTAEEIGKELNAAPEFTDGLTMYIEGKQVWGEAPADAPIPEGIEAADPDATKPTPSGTVKYGDVNCDGAVTIVDVIALNKNLMVNEKISADGQKNADVDQNGKINETDALNILKTVVEMITLPVK
ncbi:MAG: glycoside hydrolase family 9 protein [Oscillospiraceae bacterium]|nr:glycoside hydrolase family 9 protein [Oscillospiraceae bacterium]